jgi:hypothetical protein
MHVLWRQSGAESTALGAFRHIQQNPRRFGRIDHFAIRCRGIGRLCVFATSALVLAAIGTYGLVAYSVQQRAQEIGIRLALGARASSIRNMVIAQGMRLAMAGVVVGIGAAFGLSRVIASFLFGVKA